MSERLRVYECTYCGGYHIGGVIDAAHRVNAITGSARHRRRLAELNNKAQDTVAAQHADADTRTDTQGD